jgi:HTH-type transcriptional regulator/antitoxin HipB
MNRTLISCQELGTRIQYYRKKQSLTQEELALLANVGRRFVIELERGKETAQLGKVLQVLHALGVGVQLIASWDCEDR